MGRVCVREEGEEARRGIDGASFLFCFGIFGFILNWVFP